MKTRLIVRSLAVASVVAGPNPFFGLDHGLNGESLNVLNRRTRKGKTLAGKSHVVAGDCYELAIRVMASFTLKSAQVAGQPAEAVTEGELLRVTWNPAATAEVDWQLTF